MKNLILNSIFFVLAFFLTTAFSIREKPQDPPRGEKKQHIKLIKIKDGEKVELDTFITSSETFVFDGDTIDAINKALNVASDMNFDFDFDFNDDCKGKKVMIMKSNAPHHMIKELKMEGDSVKKIMITVEGDPDELGEDPMVWINECGKHKTIKIPHIPDIPCIKEPHDVKFIKRKISGNVIDLSDPGIISYKKKKLSGGREKIEIIRNEVKESKDDIEVDVDVIVDELDDIKKVEKIKVIKEEKDE